MRLTQTFLTIVAAMVSAWATLHITGSGDAARTRETALERVLRSGTLRCAYTIYDTYIDRDPNTGLLSGLSYELTEALGKALGLKVEWTAEVGSHELFAGMGTKYDANCTGYWRTPERAHGGDFTRPIFYTPTYYYVRAEENRFNTPDDFNNPAVTFSLLDGEGTSMAAGYMFPKAKQAWLPGLTPVSDRILAVATNKADVVIIESSVADGFMKNNPGRIRRFSDKPAINMASVLLIPHHEQAFKNFLDAGIAALLEKGELKAIVKRHNMGEGAVILPATEAGEVL